MNNLLHFSGPKVQVPSWGLTKTSVFLTALLTLLCITTAEGVTSSQWEIGQAVLALSEKFVTSKEGDSHPPKAVYREGDAMRQAPPTNQWYSSALFTNPSNVIHAQPMSYRILKTGLEVSLPQRELVVPNPQQRAIRYSHHNELVVEPIGFVPTSGKVANTSAWMVDIHFKSARGALMTTRLLHGSPYSYYTLTAGDARISLHGPECRIEIMANKHAALLKVGAHAYVVTIPTSAHFDIDNRLALQVHFSKNQRYMSIAGLPDQTPKTISEIINHAMVFPSDSIVKWHYDQITSTVTTTFSLKTQVMEGSEKTALLGLYPHHWNHLVWTGGLSEALQVGSDYLTVRGAIRLIPTNQFSITLPYHGLLPGFGPLMDDSHRIQVKSLISQDIDTAERLNYSNGNGSYWLGKVLGAQSQLLNIAETEADPQSTQKLIRLIEQHMESAFDDRHSNYFEYNKDIASVLPHPEEYGTIESLNDHHFHYGYWIQAAAQVALRDPRWAQDNEWGGMVNTLVADIASTDLTRKKFPFLRNFDLYEGHSWASGTALMDDGNNQESSSEAIHAWAATVLWAQATHQPRLSELAIMLYTSEIASVQQYWFDINHQVLPADYGKAFASMVFGGKFAYNTWWTDEPRQIYGINLLPITPASLYLAEDPSYLKRYLAEIAPARLQFELQGRSDGTPSNVWQDIFSEAEALIDPVSALAHWDRNVPVEYGETKTHALYWILSLQELGHPDFAVHADCPLYGVFNNGAHTYHLAYNPNNSAMTVHFSDGVTLEVPAHSLTKQ